MKTELGRAELSRFARRERGRFETLLTELVETPTVSSDPSRRPAIAKGVALAVQTLRDFGARVTVARTRGNPIVHGVFPAGKRAPTVTVYNHLDVQPASRETEPWRTDPFRLVQRAGRYFGRGATDDKGPALSALFGARAAREKGVPVSIHFLWEFEEEVGSPHFEEGLRRLGRRAATDSVVVADGLWLDRERPATMVGLRGFQGFRFVLETARADTHSGTTGGAARNPIGELMKLMCDIADPVSGRVKVPGFYDDVEKPTRREIEQLRRCGFSLSAFRRDYGLKSLRTDRPLEVLKRVWLHPTFEVHGVAGGFTGPGLKAIVPGRAEVKASCRLVPAQKPERVVRLFEKFVRERHPDVRVLAGGSALPFRGTTAGPFADAIRRAVRFAFGRTPVSIRGGGSIGAVLTMKEVLRCPVLFLDLSLPEHGYHAPNEFFDWRQASGGMAAFAKYFEELSRRARA